MIYGIHIIESLNLAAIFSWCGICIDDSATEVLAISMKGEIRICIRVKCIDNIIIIIIRQDNT